ncbi:MAG: hypothetical protein KDK34_13955 [Leptospiraceae bacterium]|nr:hypothetical protein [Leptospiraceae bacterium]
MQSRSSGAYVEVFQLHVRRQFFILAHTIEAEIIYELFSGISQNRINSDLKYVCRADSGNIKKLLEPGLSFPEIVLQKPESSGSSGGYNSLSTGMESDLHEVRI